MKKIYEIKSKSESDVSEHCLFLYFCRFILLVVFLILLFPVINGLIYWSFSNTFFVKNEYYEFFNLIFSGVEIIFTDVRINFLMTILMTVLYFLIFPIFKYSLNKLILKIVNGEKYKFSDFFRSYVNFKIYRKFLLLHVIKSTPFLIVLMLFDISDYLTFSEKYRYIFGFTFFIPLIILILIILIIIINILCFSLSEYILIDNPKISVLRVIKQNIKFSKISKWEYFKMYLSFLKFDIIFLILYNFIIVRFMIMIFSPVLLIVLISLYLYKLQFDMFKSNYYNFLKINF